MAYSYNVQLKRDKNSVPIQNSVRILEQDASTNAKVSPTALSTAPIAFQPPDRAINMVFQGAAAIRYGTNSFLDGTGVNKGYNIGAASTQVSIPCLDGNPIYVRAETGSTTLYFFFELGI